MKNQELYNLIEKASKGDKKAFEELYAQKSRNILYRCVQLMGNLQDGEDLAQEVVIKMYCNIGKLKNPQLFGSWLQSIIVNECANMYKKKNAKKRPELVAEKDDAYMVEDRMEFLPQEYVENEEKQEELLKIIHSLPEKQQNVLLLHYYEELSCAEIASVNKTTVSTVTSNLTKAKRAILKKVQQKQATVSMMAMAPVLQAAYYTEAKKVITDATVYDFGNRVIHFLSESNLATSAAAAGAAVSLSSKALIGALVGALVIAGSLITNQVVKQSYSSLSDDGQSAVPQMADHPSWDEDTPVFGVVQFQDSRGNSVENAGYSLRGMGVVIRDQAGQEVARTLTDENGNYDFGYVLLSNDAKYVLQLELPKDAGYKDISVKKYAFPGELDFRLAISVTKSPEGDIVPESGSFINPGKLAYQSHTATIHHFHWQVMENGAMIMESNDKTIDLSALTTIGGDRQYTAICRVEDVFGNTAEETYEFVINR